MSSTHLKRSGYRLHKMEFFNWGTFSNKVWSIVPGGNTSLLTGANGSGKSTVVDALLTLLVQSRKRNYNLASGSEKRKERTELTYVQGAWGRKRTSEDSVAHIEFLRTKSDHSILLAHFSNSDFEKDLTLAQVFYFQNDMLKKFYLVSETPLNIKDHFSGYSSVRDMRRELRSIPNTEIYEQFVDYSQHYRKAMGIVSDKAMDLFNQTVAIKEIGELNEFVREHMLERADAATRIQTLRGNFDNLDKAHQAIIRAKKQKEALEPIVENIKKYRALLSGVEEMERATKELPFFVAEKKGELVKEERLSLISKIEKEEQKIKEFEERLGELTNEEVSLRGSIQNDEAGRRMEEIERELTHLGQERNRRDASLSRYSQTATILGYTKTPAENTFFASRDTARKEIEKLETEEGSFLDKRDEHTIAVSTLSKEESVVSNELTSLLDRKTQIPAKSLLIRDEIMKALEMGSAELPFAGELICVKEEEKEWEGAVERVLRPFALSLLVDEAHYERVARYVNKTDLKGRLVFIKVSSYEPFSSQPTEFEKGALWQKLQIKPEAKHYRWIENHLKNRFNFECCLSASALVASEKGITKSGFVKMTGSRHEKDDRHAVDDRANYVLGWQNDSKILLYRTRLQEIRKEIERHKREDEQLKRRHKEMRKIQDALRDILTFEDFSSIDLKGIEKKIGGLTEDLNDLKKNSDHLKILTTRLEKTIAEKTETAMLRDKSAEERTRKKQNLEQIEEIGKDAEALLSDREWGADKGILELIITSFSDSTKNRQPSLRTLDGIANSIRESFLQKERALRTEREGAEKKALVLMTRFKDAYPEDTVDLDASMSSAPDFQAFLTRLTDDNLPAFEKRFKELLDEKVIMDVSLFYNFLSKQEHDIKMRIDGINEALSSIAYTPETLIRLNCEKSVDPQIRDFQSLLRQCFEDVGRVGSGANNNERHFFKIKELIDRFDKEEAWSRKVTDVRNWLNFSASELYGHDLSEKNYYSDSSGKSGGQKAKLAYTILASAISYQFGLSSSELLGNSFRFVVIDEAFSKSDDNNSRYAMELFNKLSLQLLVVSPLDKIHVVEDYINSCHFTVNNKEENESKIYNITMEEYHNQRESLEK